MAKIMVRRLLFKVVLMSLVSKQLLKSEVTFPDNDGTKDLLSKTNMFPFMVDERKEDARVNTKSNGEKRGWEALNFHRNKQDLNKVTGSSEKGMDRGNNKLDWEESADEKRGWEALHIFHGKRGWEPLGIYKKRGWEGLDFTGKKRGWGGVDFYTGKRQLGEIDSLNRKKEEADFHLNKPRNEIANQKKGWSGLDLPLGKRVDEKSSVKRGEVRVDIPLKKRSVATNSLKPDWAGMDLVLGLGLDGDRSERQKRGWEGLNLHYQVINAYNPSNDNDLYDGRKRGWEGIDTCACCHSNHMVLCCLVCNRNPPRPKPRVTTKSYKGIFYVRETVCKCCYSTKVKDCCDLCEVLS